jgi:hypothetical protein
MQPTYLPPLRVVKSAADAGRGSTMSLISWWQDRGRDFARFPADENGDVLWGMHKSGDNLERARRMDFFFLFPDKESATAFVRLANNDYEVETTFFEEKKAWDVNCSITIVPTHERVSEVESALSTMAAPFRGKPDGWGSFAQ